MHARGGETEPVFENLDFLERVAAIFQSLEVEGLRRINASRSEDEIAVDVSGILDRIPINP